MGRRGRVRVRELGEVVDVEPVCSAEDDLAGDAAGVLAVRCAVGVPSGVRLSELERGDHPWAPWTARGACETPRPAALRVPCAWIRSARLSGII